MTEEQKLRATLEWLADQIGMTSPETPRHHHYLVIRAYLSQIHDRFVKEDAELAALEEKERNK